MKELNNKPEVAAVCDEKPVCCCDSSESTPFSRLVEEKRALDEKIVKLSQVRRSKTVCTMSSHTTAIKSVAMWTPTKSGKTSV